MRDIPSTLRRISKISQQTLGVYGVDIRHTQLLDTYAKAAGFGGWQNARKLAGRAFAFENRRQLVEQALDHLSGLSARLREFSADRRGDLVDELCGVLEKAFLPAANDIFATGTAREIEVEVLERLRRQRLPYSVSSYLTMASACVGALAYILVDRRSRGFRLDQHVFASYLAPLKAASLASDTANKSKYLGYFMSYMRALGYTPALEKAVEMHLAGELPDRWNERYRLLGDEIGKQLQRYEREFSRTFALARRALERPRDEWAFMRSPNATNGNTCDRCEPEAGRIDQLVFDTGTCGLCGERTEVVDLELLNLYEELGVDEPAVWQSLPRLRDYGQGDEMTLDEARLRAQQLATPKGLPRSRRAELPRDLPTHRRGRHL